MSGTKKSGLGRGLSSLIPTSETDEADHLEGHERLLRSMVDASFELVEDHHDVTLAAYLHVGSTGEPVLFLHRPAFATLTPTTSFRLFHHIALLSNETDVRGRFVLDSWSGMYVRSGSTGSDGIHIFASDVSVYDDGALADISRAVSAMASIIHQVETAESVDDLAPVRLMVEVEDAKTTVEATITNDSGQLRTGRGASQIADEAVALSLLDASGRSWIFEECREIPVDDQRAVLTTFRDDDGNPRFGLAIGPSDNLTISANAAQRALMLSR